MRRDLYSRVQPRVIQGQSLRFVLFSQSLLEGADEAAYAGVVVFVAS